LRASFPGRITIKIPSSSSSPLYRSTEDFGSLSASSLSAEEEDNNNNDENNESFAKKKKKKSSSFFCCHIKDRIEERDDAWW